MYCFDKVRCQKGPTEDLSKVGINYKLTPGFNVGLVTVGSKLSTLYPTLTLPHGKAKEKPCSFNIGLFSASVEQILCF